MKKRNKILIITATILCVAGAVLGTVGLGMMSFDFAKLSTEKLETSTYEIKDPFTKIVVDINTADLEIAISEDETCEVVCYERKSERHRASVKDRVLVIDTIEESKWYEHIGVAIGKAKVTVYLPKSEYEALSAELSTGDIKISGGFKMKSLEIETDTGDVILSAGVFDDVDISTDTGDIDIATTKSKNIKIETDTGKLRAVQLNCERFESESDTGDVFVEKISALKSIYIVSNTGEVSMVSSNSPAVRVRTTTGNVKLSSTDAEEYMWIKTNTGDVSGSLGSEKKFDVKTRTGKIKIPTSSGNEKCEIITSTGDINLIID